MLAPATSRIERADLRILLPAWGLMLVWNIVAWRFPFFWDNILNAKIAHWYLDTGFAHLFVPEGLDAGHPPFFSLYLAGVWALAGKSLAVAHMAMLPFLLGAQTLYFRLAKRFLPAAARPWAMAVLFLEPALLAQGAQVTPDYALFCFFLLGLVGVVEGRRTWLLLGMVGMGMASFRGILMCSSLALADLAWAWLQGARRIEWRRLWPYLVMAALVLLWLVGHRQAVGWMFTPPEATYGGHRKWAGLSGLAKNLGILVWRLIDHGRVLLWLLPLVLTWRMWRRGGLALESKALLAFALAPVLSIGLLFVLFTNPIGHRYFIAVYALLGLALLGLLWQIDHRRWRQGLALLVGLSLVGGHFWVYPDQIAKGWDASLAHLPYHPLRKEAAAWLAAQGIARHDVCTDFPALAAEMHLDPAASDSTAFRSKEAGLQGCPYVLYTNVTNGFSDAELAALAEGKTWRRLWERRSWQVRVAIYQRQAESASPIRAIPYF
jgi:hypothetical protein